MVTARDLLEYVDNPLRPVLTGLKRFVGPMVFPFGIPPTAVDPPLIKKGIDDLEGCLSVQIKNDIGIVNF